MILEGTTSSGAVVPVQVTGDGKVVAEGLPGPEGAQGPQGPEGPPGPAGGEWTLTGTVLTPNNDLAEIETQNPIHFADLLSEYALINGEPDETGGRLSFSTTPSGGTTPLERMRIHSGDANGAHVFFNCTEHPSGSVKGSAVISNGSTGNYYASGTATTNPASHAEFYNPNGFVGSIATNGSATAYNTSSDYRLKENIAPVTDAVARLQKLKPCRFNFTADPSTTVDGFIAHEAQEVIPECVTGQKDAVDDNGDPVYQAIDQSKLVPLLTAALQEAIQRIEAMELKPIVKSPDGKSWVIEVDNSGNLSAVLTI